MWFENAEARKEYIETEIRSHRNAAACLPIVRKVAQQFDGKVINCRFQKALREITPKEYNIYTKTGHNGRLEIYTINRGYYITIAILEKEDMKDGKRMNADKLLESARVNYEHNLRYAYKLQREAETAEQKKAMIEGLKKQIANILSEIPYEVRDAYNIDERISFFQSRH